MSQKDIGSTLVTLTSGMIGGTTALASNTSSLDFSHLIEVAFCATFSAIIGYVVKLCADKIRHKIRQAQQRKQFKEYKKLPEDEEHS